MALRYRFKGKAGEFISGVPRKDLTQAMYDALSDEEQEHVKASALYEPATGSASPAKADSPGRGRQARRGSGETDEEEDEEEGAQPADQPADQPAGKPPTGQESAPAGRGRKEP